MYQVVQIFKKFQLYNKLKINLINIQFNIIIVDIDKKNKDFKHTNILQLKWILYILILKKNYKKILNKNQNLEMN